MDWQPIETAPKDGTTILGYYSASKEYGLVDWHAEGGCGCWLDNFDGCEVGAPTHWRPLPEPPIA